MFWGVLGLFLIYGVIGFLVYFGASRWKARHNKNYNSHMYSKDSTGNATSRSPMQQSSYSSKYYSKEEIAGIISDQVHWMMSDADEHRDYTGAGGVSFRTYQDVRMSVDADCIRLKCYRDTYECGTEVEYRDYLQHFYYRRGMYYWVDIVDKMNNGETIFSGFNNKYLPKGFNTDKWPGDIDDLRQYLENYPFDGFRFEGDRIRFNKNHDNTY